MQIAGCVAAISTCILHEGQIANRLLSLPVVHMQIQHVHHSMASKVAADWAMSRSLVPQIKLLQGAECALDLEMLYGEALQTAQACAQQKTCQPCRYIWAILMNDCAWCARNIPS